MYSSSSIIQAKRTRLSELVYIFIELHRVDFPISDLMFMPSVLTVASAMSTQQKDDMRQTNFAVGALLTAALFRLVFLEEQMDRTRVQMNSHLDNEALTPTSGSVTRVTVMQGEEERRRPKGSRATTTSVGSLSVGVSLYDWSCVRVVAHRAALTSCCYRPSMYISSENDVAKLLK